VADRVADEELERLVRSHEVALLRVAFLLCGDVGRSEDLVQDALVRVLRRWRSAGLSVYPFAYARRVLINEFLAWRRLRSSTERVGPVEDLAIADHADRLAEQDVVWRLLSQLRPRARTVLVLRFYEQLSDAEIASILGCRQATVRSITSRALQGLRNHPMLATVMKEA
jgi:RNA polymerase sigma factor (sigma-70 family)